MKYKKGKPDEVFDPTRGVSAIYKIECLGNSQFYIGATKDIQVRWDTHRFNLRNNKHHSKTLQEDWNVYGEDNFMFIIIEPCELSDLKGLERDYLEALAPTYNTTCPSGERLCDF